MKVNGFESSSRVSSMMPPPRPPLMTPSASPPVLHFRRSDAPSPSKKRRISETPSLVGSSSRSGTISSSSSFLPSPPTSRASEDPFVESASARRVLDIWSQLADKYSRGIDEDDIVDIRTGKVIKDRGFLSSSDTEWKFGCFMNLSDEEDEEEGGPSRVAQGGPDDDALEGDDGPDELDAFANLVKDDASGSGPGLDGDDDDGLQRSPGMLRVKRLNPIAEPNPEDAADLAEFLEAEERRKEEFGDADGETEDDEGQCETGIFVEENDTDADSVFSDDGEGDAIALHESAVDTDAESIAISDRSNSPVYEFEGDEGVHELVQDSLPVVIAEEALEISDNNDSEDEFGNWTEDEGTFVYAVEAEQGTSSTKQLPVAKEGKKNTKRNQSSKLKDNGHSENAIGSQSKEAIQLQTPPRSTSSVPSEPRALFKKPNISDLSDNCTAHTFEIPSDDERDADSAALDDFTPSPLVGSSNTKRRSLDSFTASRLIPEVVIPIRNPVSTRPHPPVQTGVIDLSENDDTSVAAADDGGKRNKGKTSVPKATRLRPSVNQRQDARFSPRSEDGFASSVSRSPEEGFKQKIISRHGKKRRRNPSHGGGSSQETKDEYVEHAEYSRPRFAPSSSSHTPSHEDNSDADGRAGPSTSMDRRRHTTVQPRSLGHPPEHYWGPYPYTHPGYRFKSEHLEEADHHESHMPYSYPSPVHDPAAQFQLAHALHTISAIMGGGRPPFPPSTINSHSPYPQWTPRTPSRRHSRSSAFETPQSLALDPPLSSPVRSESSEPSSPAKLESRGRSRSKTHLRAPTPPRPRSAIRGSKSSHPKSPFKLHRRVSFSSPEAVEIDIEDTLPSPSDVEDEQFSDGDAGHHVQSSLRAQTPGPPPTRKAQDCLSKHGKNGNRVIGTPRKDQAENAWF